MKNNRLIKTVFLVILLVMSMPFIITGNVSALIINPGTYYQIGNENYSVSRTMTFDHITFNATYITFNNTGFNISSANDIYINLSYLHPTPTSVSNNSRILTFNATTSAGTVQFNISGFTAGYDYRVYRNGTNFVNVTANASGNIYFTSAVWSMKNISVWWSNYPSTFSSPSPTNGTTGISRWHATNVTVSDRDGDSLTVCFWNNKTGSWVKAQQNNTVTANTTVRDMNSSYSSDYITKYWWKVTVFDGFVNSSAVYCFTTVTAGAPPGGGATAPTVTTNTTTGIGATSATFNGYLLSDGGDTTSCGFRYDIDSGSPYASNHTVGVVVTHTAFSYAPTLLPGTRYYLMAWGTNPQGFSAGSEISIVTLPNPPVLIVTTSTNASITMSWTKGSGANYTRIQRSSTGYPASISDGTNIYNNTGTGCTDSGLASGTTYYYRAWSMTQWDTTSKWSSTSLTFAETTIADPSAPTGSTDTLFNGSDLVTQPFNTTFSPFTNLFSLGFFVIPLGFIAAALFVKTKDLPLTSLLLIIGGAFLIGADAFTGWSGASVLFGAVVLFGVATLLYSVFYGGRRLNA